MMRYWYYLFAATLLPMLCLTACSDDDDAYPSIVTELVDGLTNSRGEMEKILTDDDVYYSLTNPQSGLVPNAAYRCLCGYTADGVNATLYTLSGAYLLRDSTEVAVKDPLAIVSAWQTRRYINLHLSVKTQGGTQYFGYVTDSIVGRHAYLSLHHRQNGDPEAYSTDVYASLPLDSIPATTITLQNSYEFQR
ncbi:MAG: hypothetical protein LUC44_08405 [Prevotellaceae bacterium]|nr:hypothetical protein [Prevotellaceae bacterium]